MSRFIQLHFLTIYPPSNPNRDDTGRPKSANYGGVDRLRISSQSIKRAARMSEAMQRTLEGKLGERSRRFGERIKKALIEGGVESAEAEKAAYKLTELFGKVDKENKGHTRQLAFISPDELTEAVRLAKDHIDGKELPEIKKLKEQVLRTADSAVDIAMFGRMLADDPKYNREAAVQVSHALTTHRALIEDDYYTAVDDLNTGVEDVGAAFVGDAGFGSGVYYLYAVIDTVLLRENLSDDRELSRRAASALTGAFATATPSGKRNSFAHHTRAGFIRAEAGSQQPRSLAGAFFKPVQGEDLMAASISELRKMADSMNRAYGDCADSVKEMDVAAGTGSLDGIRQFVDTAFDDD